MNKVNYLDFPQDYKKRKKNYFNAFDRVMKKGVYVLGEEVASFEEEFANFLGTKYCVGVANGLEALQISLMALGVGRGDEVITTPLSAVATTLAILAVGAKPVFVDINENGQIDESKIEKEIRDNTKAVMPVHLYGQSPNIENIRKICKEHKLFLIEDACQAHCSRYNGKMVGSFGDAACYSFYPTKNLGAIGDGGAITTNNEKLALLAKEIRDYGQKTKYIHIRYGLNSRLDELQASILREKLKFLGDDNRKRRKIAERYIKQLSGLNNVKIILSGSVEDSNFHLFAIRTVDRDRLQRYLKENGVTTLVHYPISIPDQPMFNNLYKKVHLPVVRKFVNETLSLPCHPLMKISEVDYVCRLIKKFFL